MTHRLPHPSASLVRRLFVAVVMLLLGAPIAAADAARPAKRILFIDTQHRGVPWADAMVSGFNAGLGEFADQVEVYFEHLDRARFGADFLPEQAALYRLKYARLPPDVMIAFGRGALGFALEQRNALAPGRPLLYSSLVLPDDFADYADVAGFLETPNVDGTLRLMKRLNPAPRHIYAVGQLATTQADAAMRALLAAGAPPGGIVMLDDADVDAIADRLRQVPPDAAVLIVGYLRGAGGVLLTENEVTRRLASASPAPVYSLWDVAVRNGVVGGQVLSSELQGRVLGQYARRLLAGEPVSALARVAPAPTQTLVDWQALTRFGMARVALPDDSIVLNKPPTLYETNPGAVIGGIATIVVLSLGLIALVVVIRTRHRATAEIRESETRYRTLFEESPNPLAVRDNATLHFMAINRALSQTFGYAAEELLGKSIISLVAPEQRDAALSRAQQLDIDGWLPVQSAVWRCQRRDGTELTVETFSRAIEFEGRPARLLMLNDIAARVAAEKALQQLNAELEQRVAARTAELQRATAQLVQNEKLAALGSLVAGVAHELNTPLGNSLTVVTSLEARVREFSDAATGGTLRKSTLIDYTGDACSACSLLERNIRRAAELVQSFKQLAVDQASLHRSKFLLAELVKETVRAIAPTVRQHSITVDEAIDVSVDMDSYRSVVEHVLTNLLLNAVTHGPGQRAQLNINITAYRADDDKVVLVVSDDGIGMTPDVVKHAFDPFFTTRLGQGGSGLGLYLVHNLVTGPLGGSIRVDSRIGLGTRFELTLPTTVPDISIVVH